MPPKRGSRRGGGRGFTKPKKSKCERQQFNPPPSRKPVCTCIGTHLFHHNPGLNEPINCEEYPHNAFLSLPCPRIGSLGLPVPVPLQSPLVEREKGVCTLAQGEENQATTFTSGQVERRTDAGILSLNSGVDQTSGLETVTGGRPIEVAHTFQTGLPFQTRVLEARSEIQTRGKVPLSSQTFLVDDLKSPVTPPFGPITPQNLFFRPHSGESDPSSNQGAFITLRIRKHYLVNGWKTDTTNMAPVRDPNSVQGSVKEVIQNLFDVQSQVHGYVPETQAVLVDKMTELAASLSHLQKLTSETSSPNNPIHGVRIAPEIIDYVDDGRNPDIYTRDFVELVQRGNSVMNGKQQAFRDFSEVYAQVLKEHMPELTGQVDKVMGNARSKAQQRVIPDEKRNGNGISS